MPVKRAATRSAPSTASPRSSKTTRRSADAPPVHIRVIGATLGPRDRDMIVEKLGRQLGKFESSIKRATVRLFDVNGPKGGRDQVVQIKVVLTGQPTVVVEERGVTVQRVLGRAIKGVGVAVKRSVQRRRTKPLRTSSRTDVRGRSRTKRAVASAR